MNLPLHLNSCGLALTVFFAASCAVAGDIRSHGAVGDGTADDTAAIEKAVAQGGTIDFGDGTFRITRTIKVNLDQVGWTSLRGLGTSRIVMAGPGPAFHFVGTHTGSADPKSFQPNVWDHQRMPVVSGLEIIGDHPEANGIEATGVMQLTLTNMLIRQCHHAVHLTGRNRNLLISACHIYHNRGIGVFYDHVNLHQSNIVGSHISYCNQGGIVFRGGEVRNVHVGTCDIESNMSADHEPTANILIDCREGSTAEVAITGCTIQHNSKSPGSANIRVLGQGITSGKDPTVTQEGHITITGNVFSDVMVNVHLQQARGVSIVGNTFWEGFEHDLLIEDSQAIVVGPNDLDRNPRYVVNGHWGEDTNGIVLKNCRDCKLSGLLVKGVWNHDAAIELTDCQRCTLNDLSIFDCKSIGIAMNNCDRCRVTQCMVGNDLPEASNWIGFRLKGGRENSVMLNKFAGGSEIEAASATEFQNEK